jgi:hypothetical protein
MKKLKLIFDGPYKRRTSAGILVTEYRYKIDISTPDGKKAFAEYKKAKESSGYPVAGTDAEPLIFTNRFFGKAPLVNYSAKGSIYQEEQLTEQEMLDKQAAIDAENDAFNRNLARVRTVGLTDQQAIATALFGK